MQMPATACSLLSGASYYYFIANLILYSTVCTCTTRHINLYTGSLLHGLYIKSSACQLVYSGIPCKCMLWQNSMSVHVYRHAIYNIHKLVQGNHLGNPLYTIYNIYIYIHCQLVWIIHIYTITYYLTKWTACQQAFNGVYI